MRTVEEMKKAVVVCGDSAHAVGKIQHAVFHPTEARLVGFIVHRHDTLGMVKHKDRFLAFDSFTVKDGKICASSAKDVWDKGACSRLGIDYDSCVIWRTMPVADEEGHDLGRVDDVEYDEVTGKVLAFTSKAGMVSDALVGGYRFDASDFARFEHAKIVVRRNGGNAPLGGLAAKAGEAAGKLKVRVEELVSDDEEHVEGPGDSRADVSGEEGPQSENRGLAYAFGRQLGRTRGMFASFKEEYDKEVNRR